MPTFPRKYIFFAVLSVGLFVTGLIAVWLGGHGYVDITVDNRMGGEAINYDITDESTGQTQHFQSSQPHFKRLVRKGNYEVVIQTVGRNSWQPAMSVDGFLNTTSISLDLKKESGRAFVGNNPAPCMYYTGVQLLSYECQGSGGITKHAAATANTPTYTQSIPEVPDTSSVLGITVTGEGTVLVTKTTDFDDGVGVISARLLGADGNPGPEFALNDIDSSHDYAVATYHQGFLLYSRDLQSVLFYNTLHSRPLKIDVSSGHGSLKPVGLTAGDRGIVAAFASADGSDDTPSSMGQSTVITYLDGKTHNYQLKQAISAAAFCGSDLCTLSGDRLTAYNNSQTLLRTKYQITHVNGVVTGGGATYADTSRGILQWVGSDMPDHYIYTPGTYSSCGLSVNAEKPVLCLLTVKHNKVALLLDGELQNYPIDASVAQLLKSGEFDTVSAYQQYLFVTPNVNKDTNNPFYSSEQKTRSTEIINRQTKAAHLDLSHYTVVNTITY
jgi:hypothetical protein